MLQVVGTIQPVEGCSTEWKRGVRMIRFPERVQTHMPPELLTKGKLSKAADVYAFGILVWEMVTGERAWAGMSHTQVLSAVVTAPPR